MQLALSVRVAEAACKTRLNVPVRDLTQMAAELGYTAICMRASGAGVLTPRNDRLRIRAEIEDAGLRVSMVTADSDVPLNNSNGPDSLRDIGPSLDVAEDFGCDLIRVCLKIDDDVEHACRAADRAAARNIRLAHQCHTTSLFEEVEPTLALLQRIGRANFGLIYEPANLMLCHQTYGEETLRKFRPYLMNVYVQNHVLDPDGPDVLETYCLGPRRFHHLPLWEAGGVDFAEVFAALRAVGYGGTFTVHQAENTQTLANARAYAGRCAEWFRSMTAGTDSKDA
ncbi:MAG: sugar phosphate isomerase/epimerase [Planctomycetes bacterium]|nr:sugar phosphate isomerase/epimerase [Planctomycetota bacterium]